MRGSTPHRYDAPAGSYLVRTDQPLGTLASYLLEPASEDGVVTWNLVDRLLTLRAPYPDRAGARAGARRDDRTALTPARINMLEAGKKAPKFSLPSDDRRDDLPG